MEVLPVVADLNHEEDAQRFVGTAVDRFGGLDLLVNCAGSSPGGSLLNLSESDWLKVEPKISGLGSHNQKRRSLHERPTVGAHHQRYR